MALSSSAREDRGGCKASPKVDDTGAFDPCAAQPCTVMHMHFRSPPRPLLARAVLPCCSVLLGQPALFLLGQERRQLKGSSCSCLHPVPALHQGAPAQIKAF